MHKQDGFTVMELLVVMGIFCIMFMALAPFVQIAKDRANRINCANNLMKVGLALHGYAADHDDTFPQDLEALYPDYLESQGAFDCPANKAAKKNGGVEYRYVAGLTEASSPKEVVVEDLDGNHKRSGKNVLRIDGSIEWVSARR